MKIREILARREAIRLEMRSLVDASPTGDMPADAATRFTQLEAEAATLNAAETRQAAIDDLDRRAGGAPVTETPLAEAVATRGVRKEDRMADRVARETGVATANLSAGRAIHGLLTGRWQGAEAEQRVMAGNVGTAGGFLLPSPVSVNIVDLVRNRSVLINAGAITLPMGGPSLRIPQVTGDPGANVRAEGSAITETDGTFAALNLTAWSIGALVRVNNELLDDAPQFAAELDTQLSAVMALKLDSLGLYGTGASQPLGLRRVVGLQEIVAGVVGGDQNDGASPSQMGWWDPVLDLMQKLEQANATPQTLVWAPRTRYEFAKLKDGLGAYLNSTRAPDAINTLTKLVSNQISISETQGSANTASTIFIGDWSNVAIAIRSDITIEMSREADTAFKQNQTLVRAIMRADVGVVRPDKLGRLIGVL